MKKIKYITLVLLGVLSVSSCKDYLTVDPLTTVAQPTLYESETGFKDALTGIYMQMKSTQLYGENMTMTTMEHLVSSWETDVNSVGSNLNSFNYTDAQVQNTFEGVFGAEYKAIANINAILDHIDEKKDVFQPGMYETIKSECLALRAYCHLDILRLFGPIPTNPTIGNKLPYVTHLSTTPNAGVSFSVYQEKLLKDLDEAAALAQNVDPILNYSLAELKDPGPAKAFYPSDYYLAYRYLRMNYYAVKALQARAYLWFGNKGKAYECARVVIDAKNSNGTEKFRLGTSADLASEDYAFSSEHIFGLFDNGLFRRNDALLNILKRGAPVDETLYGKTGKDIREMNGLWKTNNATKKTALYKFKVKEEASTLKQIPLLRISEMYLIAVETGPQAEAQQLWDKFRIARNIGALALPADAKLLQDEVIKEYRKELYGEGQAFFAYKRVNAPRSMITFAPATAIVNYLLPMPKTETVNLDR
ncbi:RagB/SusD family nutrient uptake outer membrane protein [Solitalea sp. MAHUQ-68]|uniref:RagB/SusD family nutrient uptake outer membrane protein n=1 Tax=Solitalea agri TaxID=2953739 RepID=A0A9X2JD13_9SPHI|nr:RagB/SusD family nutrient uptake outer membrane protein [Solitalea agri]MCO4294052.1 RagB/SusD family nutrient uptake outer membrane protein [Solitalea agri]